MRRQPGVQFELGLGLGSNDRYHPAITDREPSRLTAHRRNQGWLENQSLWVPQEALGTATSRVPGAKLRAPGDALAGAAAARLYLPLSTRFTSRLPVCRTRPGASLRFNAFGGLGRHLPPDFTHLACQSHLHVLAPNETARTVLIRALVQLVQLLPPFTNQRIKPYQLGLKLRCASLLAIYHDEIEAVH